MYMSTCRLHDLCPLQGTEDTSNAICSLFKIKIAELDKFTVSYSNDSLS